MAPCDRLETEMGFVYICLMEGVKSGGKRMGLDCWWRIRGGEEV